jgi:hypothetical protein
VGDNIPRSWGDLEECDLAQKSQVSLPGQSRSTQSASRSRTAVEQQKTIENCSLLKRAKHLKLEGKVPEPLVVSKI